MKTPFDAVEAAMQGLLASSLGWSAISAGLARYLMEKKGYAPAKLWLESVFSNLEAQKRADDKGTSAK